MAVARSSDGSGTQGPARRDHWQGLGLGLGSRSKSGQTFGKFRDGTGIPGVRDCRRGVPLRIRSGGTPGTPKKNLSGVKRVVTIRDHAAGF